MSLVFVECFSGEGNLFLPGVLPGKAETNVPDCVQRQRSEKKWLTDLVIHGGITYRASTAEEYLTIKGHIIRLVDGCIPFFFVRPTAKPYRRSSRKPLPVDNPARALGIPPGHTGSFVKRWPENDIAIMACGECLAGLPEGLWHFYHSNGKLAYKGSFISGYRYGEWERYSSNGTQLPPLNFNVEA